MTKTVHMIDVPAKNIPPFRYELARKQGIKQIMMTTWGGLGDQVCSEPTLRYAFKLFKDYKISVLTSFPELFTHLPFEKIYDNKSEEAKALNDEEWLVIHTSHTQHSMAADFIAHHYTQCVDYSSLVALQRQLPIEERQVKLIGSDRVCEPSEVVIHPGRHWQSKTFPKKWWSEIIKNLCDTYERVTIVGKDIDENTGTVDVDVPKNCLDLRNKLSLGQLVQTILDSKVVLTNDSAPLHIAAAGESHILYFATCKHSEYLTHWRKGVFGWRMKNLALDGLFNYQDSIPIREEELRIDEMPKWMLDASLPSVNSVIEEVRKCVTDN